MFSTGDEDHDRNEVGRFFSVDYGAIERFESMIQRSGEVVRNQMLPGAARAGTRTMPNLPELLVDRHVLSPTDLETIYGLTEADIFHGRHDLDQIFSLRPHPDAVRYRTPVRGLYLCGSGAHPAGVFGVPGHNAARRVIDDLKRN